MSFRKMALVLALVAAAGCQVEKTQEGELPDVDVTKQEGQLPDVDIKGGQLPKYEVDVKVPDVDVRMDTTQIVVPRLERDTTRNR